MRAGFPQARIQALPPRGSGPVSTVRTACACLAALLIALCAGTAWAAPTTYTGEAPVNSQGDSERTEALKTALANVVIQVTGDAGVLARSDVASACGKAERYVLQYRYRLNASSSPDGAKFMLVAEFDSTAVDEMLGRLGLGAPGAVEAEAAATPSEATVWVGGIHSADEYARVLGYLGKSNLVRSVQPTQARGDGMLIHLSLATDLARFLDAVGFERTLSVVNASTPVEGVVATLTLAP
ncbi:MAG: DUF2066 domain-containing protein [Rhodanobacteraceae bacterium]